MGGRLRAISRSITKTICGDATTTRPRLAFIFAFFRVLQIILSSFKWGLWRGLRTEVWGIDEREYKASFQDIDPKAGLQPIGDLGYSGSTFFTTPDSKFLIKSVPRRFEYSFFKDDMVEPYGKYMREHANSLVVRILDFLYPPCQSIGGLLKLVPTHHIVMENAMYGKESDPRGDKWETYDLKPLSYFYPERDLLDGALASETTLSKLADKFEDKIRVTREQYNDLMITLEEDTAFLAKCNVVDYSLFVVRCPPNSTFKAVSSKMSEWRAGVLSIDKKWKYRVVLLDFFWAKHKTFPQSLTGVVKAFNLMAKKGPMSITTNPAEYQKRFLKMVSDIVEFR